MSVKIMSMVFDRYPNGDAEMVLALALADHANDQGLNIFPGIPEMALKTRQSERSVQRQLRKMEAMGWLECVHRSRGGRSSRYRINPRWVDGESLEDIKLVDNSNVNLDGDNLSPLKNRQTVTPEVRTVTPEVSNGDTAVSPYPSVIIKNHHLSVSETVNQEKQTNLGEVIADDLIRLGVEVVSTNADLKAWVDAGLTQREAVEAVNITRGHKPFPELIPFRYLIRVLETQRQRSRPPVTTLSVGQVKPPWYLNADLIAARAYELRLVHGTVTDKRMINSESFQRRVLEEAGLSIDEWTQWRAWRKGVV